jgi:T4 RnlA family RNA ligase
MLHVQEYLKNHTYDDLKEEFDIRHKLYDDRVIFKYGVKSPKYHPIVMECRGLILSLDNEIVSRPFDRFFNLYEGDDHLDFNWNDSIVFTKLDGSLIQGYNYNGKWYVGTSGTAFAEGETPMKTTYHDLFVKAVGGRDLQEVFRFLPEGYTFLFELTSPENRIVTPYSETKITLLAVRDNETGKYVNYSVIDQHKETLFDFCDIAKRYDLNKEKDVLDFVDSLPQLEEGVVCFDTKTQKRIKVKNVKYVAVHHLRGNEVTHKSIITLLLKGEMDEYLTYFPEDFDFMKTYIDEFNNLKEEIVNVFNKYKHIEDQKEFALKAKDLKYSSVLFQLRKGKHINEIFHIDNLNYFVKLLTEQQK